MTMMNPGRVVRPLGAFERTVDFYMHRNPVQFSLVAELDRRESALTLAPALERLQRRHPLLGVAVDRTAPEAVFRVSENAIPVEVAAADTPWQSVIADEQTRPIPAIPGPLVRAVLIPQEAGCAVVLTFAHQVADGVGGLQALLDLVGILNGEELKAGGDPQAQEDLLAHLDTAAGAAADTAVSAVDERMNTVGRLVPFAGRSPHVDALALGKGLTERLVSRCRSESTTVHAAMCTAASVVLHRRGREFVRVLSPIDLRRAAGLPDEVVVRFTAGKTGSDARDARDFWTLARRTGESLSLQRTPDVVRAGSAAIAAHPPSSPGEAEAMMTAATAADIQITNLGVADLGGQSPNSICALWGPAQITQLQSEHILGVVTVGGQLRLTDLTHDPVAALVPQMVAVLAEECA